MNDATIMPYIILNFYEFREFYSIDAFGLYKIKAPQLIRIILIAWGALFLPMAIGDSLMLSASTEINIRKKYEGFTFFMVFSKKGGSAALSFRNVCTPWMYFVKIPLENSTFIKRNNATNQAD